MLASIVSFLPISPMPVPIGIILYCSTNVDLWYADMNNNYSYAVLEVVGFGPTGF